MPVSNAIMQYDISVRKVGFQPLVRRGISVKPNQIVTLNLSRAQPVRGVVRSPDGRPIAGVEIRQYIKDERPGDTNLSGQYGSVLAITDAEGHFTLSELADHAAYLLVAESKEYGKKGFSLESPFARELSIKFGPILTVSGIVRGELSQLTKEKGQPSVSVRELPTLAVEKFHGWLNIIGTAPVESVDGKQQFTIRDLLPGEVTIRAGEHVVRAKVSESEPNPHVTIDLTQAAAPLRKREVVLRLTTPGALIPPQGTIQVYMTTGGEDRQSKLITVPLEKGAARFQAYVSGQVHYQPNELLGYWFQGSHGLIEPGEGPQEITVAAMPAGAIAGQVLNEDGTPAADNILVGVQGVANTNTKVFGTSGAGASSGGFGTNVSVDDHGRYFITPLPLGGSYVVTAARGHTFQIAPFTLDDAQPTVNITLQFPHTTTVEGTILDPQGRPLPRFPCDLQFSSRGIRGLSSGRSSSSYSDAKGHFRFADLSVGVGQYALDVRPRRDFCPVHVPLPLDGKPVTVRLQRGLVIEGQILDSDTELPVPGVELYAMTADDSPGNAAFCEAEGLTDAEGRFRFSNLEDRPYGINNRSFGGVKFPPDQTWTPGSKPIVLRWPVPEGSPLKPHAKKAKSP